MGVNSVYCGPKKNGCQRKINGSRLSLLWAQNKNGCQGKINGSRLCLLWAKNKNECQRTRPSRPTMRLIFQPRSQFYRRRRFHHQNHSDFPKLAQYCSDLPGLSCMPRLARTLLYVLTCLYFPVCLDLPGLSCMPGLARTFLYAWTCPDFPVSRTYQDFPVCPDLSRLARTCPDLPKLAQTCPDLRIN